MVKQNRTNRKVGRTSTLALLVVLAASSAFALGNPGFQNRQQQRFGEIRVMNIFGLNYSATNWSAVTSQLAARPGDAGNPAVMWIPLSLGNVYLNRFERGKNQSDLERAIQMFERVTGNYGWWGGREGSGSVVTYLDISVRRLQGECDIGGVQSRIDALSDAAMAITAEEADALLRAEGLESTLPIAVKFDASRVSLLATAASFLGEDSRAPGWAQTAEELSANFQSSECQTMETFLALSQGALSYHIANRSVPAGLVAVFTAGVFRQGPGCSPIVSGYETSGPVLAVTEGDSLSLAIHDSQVVAVYLDRLLSQYPPGSQCGIGADDPDDTPIDVNR
jgi:hypothetical protein